MLFNEPKLLKSRRFRRPPAAAEVSVLFNEPKLLKSYTTAAQRAHLSRFSALQRAEIAEISPSVGTGVSIDIGFSALQRAEIAEIVAKAIESLVFD